jgi:hypothetical protein
MTTRRPATCPQCGARLDEPAQAPGDEAPDRTHVRYDLEKLAQIAARENAYDETVKVRVTQEQIRKLVEKRRRKPRA